MASKKNSFYSDPMFRGASMTPSEMPGEVIMKNYPKVASATYDLVYDDIIGIDKQENKDVKGGTRATTKY